MHTKSVVKSKVPRCHLPGQRDVLFFFFFVRQEFQSLSNSSNNIYVRKTGIQVKAVPKSESKRIIIRRGLGSIRPHWAGCRRLARTERKPLMDRASVPGRAAWGKKRAASSSPIPPFSLSLFSFFFFFSFLPLQPTATVPSFSLLSPLFLFLFLPSPSTTLLTITVLELRRSRRNSDLLSPSVHTRSRLPAFPGARLPAEWCPSTRLDPP